jgi:hypothetical protein
VVTLKGKEYTAHLSFGARTGAKVIFFFFLVFFLCKKKGRGPAGWSLRFATKKGRTGGTGQNLGFVSQRIRFLYFFFLKKKKKRTLSFGLAVQNHEIIER